MDIMQKSLEKHKEWNGKIEVVSRVHIDDAKSLSLAYTPGLPNLVLKSKRILSFLTSLPGVLTLWQL